MEIFEDEWAANRLTGNDAGPVSVAGEQYGYTSDAGEMAVTRAAPAQAGESGAGLSAAEKDSLPPRHSDFGDEPDFDTGAWTKNGETGEEAPEEEKGWYRNIYTLKDLRALSDAIEMDALRYDRYYSEGT